MMSTTVSKLSIFLFSSAALAPALAYAQVENAPAPQSYASSSTELDEIVITAQKREQRFNDVGLTVNVLTWQAPSP